MRFGAEICQIRMSVELSAIGIANRITHFTDVDCYIFFYCNEGGEVWGKFLERKKQIGEEKR